MSSREDPFVRPIIRDILRDLVRPVFGFSASAITYLFRAALNASNVNPLVSLTGTTVTQVATGSVVIPDSTGTLITLPAGYPAVPGARIANTRLGGATFGAELWDAAASQFVSGTYAWAAYGANTIANDGGALKINTVNDASGAYVFLRNTADLSADLVIGKQYRLYLKSKSDKQSATVHVYDGASFIPAKKRAASTDYIINEVYFTARSTIGCFVGFNSTTDVSQNVWIKDLSLSEVVPTFHNNTGDMFLAVTGDSIAAGHHTVTPHYPAIYENDSGRYDSEVMYRMQVLHGAEIYYENHAKGGQNFSWVASTGAISAINSTARAILIHCGVNDVAASRAWAAIEADLNTVAAALKPYQTLFISEILPWTAGSNTQAATIREYNGYLATWCSANNAVLVAGHDALGQIRIATGELDDIKSEYNYDNVHLSQAGVDVLAQIWLTALIGVYGTPISVSAVDLYSTYSVLESGLTRYTGFGGGNPSGGVLVEPAITNKITARKVNPTDTTNLSKSGDAAAVLSVVDDTAALTAAGLLSLCTSGKVYKLDNSAGAAVATVNITGGSGNTNPHYVSAYARRAVAGGVDQAWFGLAGYRYANVVNSTYARVSGTGPAISTTTTRLDAVAGVVVYFILPELIEASALGSPVVPGVGVTDALAAYTRPARYGSILGAEIAQKLRFDLVSKEALSSAGRTTTLFDDLVRKVKYNNGLLVFRDESQVMGADLVDTMNTAAEWTAFGTNTVEDDGVNGVKITYVDNVAGAYSFFSAARGLSSNLTVGKTYIMTYSTKVNTGNVGLAHPTTGAAINSTSSTSFVSFSVIFTCTNATTNGPYFTGLGAGEIVWIKDVTFYEVAELTYPVTLTADTIYQVGIDMGTAASMSIGGTEVATATFPAASQFSGTTFVGSKVVSGTASETLSGTITVIQSSNDIDAGAID